MYFSLYSLLQQYIYGLDVVLTEHMDLTLTLLATICCLFLVSLPFLVVYKLISWVAGL